MSGYTYRRSEPQLWTVGSYDAGDTWRAAEDCGTEREAQEVTSWLNGGPLPASRAHLTADGHPQQRAKLVDGLPITTVGLADHQVAVVVTVDGETRVFGIAVESGTNIDMRHALAGTLRTACRAAGAALLDDGPWMPSTLGADYSRAAEPGPIDEEAAYADFMIIIRQYGLNGLRVNRVHETMSTFDPRITSADVARWIRQGIAAGEVEAALDGEGEFSTVRLPS